MICWGGLSFVTVAASGWQMVLLYGSSGGNLMKGASEGGRYGIDRERTHACRSVFGERGLRFEATRTAPYLASRLDERGGRRER